MVSICFIREHLVTCLPLLDEIGQLGKEVAARRVVGRVFAIEGHDVVVALLHVLKEYLQLLCLSPSFLHASLHNDRDLVFGVELAWIREITGIERHLNVLDVVNILLRISLQLFDIDLLCCDDTTDLIGESLPAGVLVAHNTLNHVGKGGLVLVILQHAKT